MTSPATLLWAVERGLRGSEGLSREELGEWPGDAEERRTRLRVCAHEREARSPRRASSEDEPAGTEVAWPEGDEAGEGDTAPASRPSQPSCGSTGAAPGTRGGAGWGRLVVNRHVARPHPELLMDHLVVSSSWAANAEFVSRKIYLP